jgi:hypothetical protein
LPTTISHEVYELALTVFQSDPTVLEIQEKGTVILWRDPSSVELSLESIARGRGESSHRTQKRTGLAQESAPSMAQGLSKITLTPSIAQMPEAVQRLLQRAESLPDASTADTRRRVEEIGPIPEVIEAIQEILRAQNVPDVELPRYEEGGRYM